jgi:hypothetical protein
MKGNAMAAKKVERNVGSKTEAAVKAKSAAKDAAGNQGDGKPPAADTPVLGIPDSLLRKGTIAIDDNAPIESLILAYQAVEDIADAIYDSIKAKAPGRKEILIHNPADFKAIEEQCAFVRQADAMLGAMNRLLDEAGKILNPPPPHAGGGNRYILPEIATAGALITSALQFASLFKADHQFKNYKIDLEDQILAVTVSGKLVAEKYTVHNSSLIPLCLAIKPDESASVKKLDDLRDARAKLVSSGDDLEARKDDDKTKKLQGKIVNAIAEFDAFEAILLKLDPSTGVSRISELTAADALQNFLNANKPLLLWLKAAAAGGGTHAKDTTLWADITYSGGAIVVYALFDSDGKLLEAKPISRFGGVVHVAKIREATTSLLLKNH